jgi:hypothetical protein
MESKERTLGSRASIFKKTDRAIPELEQQAEDVKHPAYKAVKQQRIKATFYINPEDVLAIDEMQSNEFRQTGKKPERSDIVSRAIQAYKEQRDELAAQE